ncbi:MAG: deoxyguanosinetriphosphate triphosphohydrolase [Acidobacteriota bacterium]|nr:deoxyguanosinetriphosphate triphosphohydrolase [Acidobacteriota bacterium]
MKEVRPQRLARYAMTLSKSRGRRHAEPEHPYRNAYERDRDRIIHSRAFRRLENKTQVFTRRYSDHFRTRLTHTLEVTQISRTVARGLALNQDLTEALALVHDIGHPPFGHAGEEALNRLMKKHGGRFDHNLHALRIVELFEQKYADFPGLNLTFEVREGIIKHSRDYDPGEYPEMAEYLLEKRPPVEAQIIDRADEIAYNCADLDDGFEAKLLSVRMIRDGVPLFDRFWRVQEKQHPMALEKLIFNETLRRVVDALVTDLIGNTSARLRHSHVRSVTGVRGLRFRVAEHSERISTESDRLKRFLQRRLYAHPEVGAERKGIAIRMERLFNHYLNHPRSMPAAHSAKVGIGSAAQVVCDYIAGMTDNFFTQQYQRIFGEGGEK